MGQLFPVLSTRHTSLSDTEGRSFCHSVHDADGGNPFEATAAFGAG